MKLRVWTGLSTAIFLTTTSCTHLPTRAPASTEFGDGSFLQSVSALEATESELDDDDDEKEEASRSVAPTSPRSGPLSSRERARLLKRLKGVYDNASAAQPPAIAMIEAAQKSIDIEIYEMHDRDFLAALNDAITRGVKVRVVKDANPLGTSCLVFNPISNEDSRDCVLQKQIVERVRASGGAYVPFEKSAFCGKDDAPPAQRSPSCYQHGKMIITDGKRALLSSGNFNSTSFCNLSQNPRTCNRDYSFITASPSAIRKLNRIFELDLQGTRAPVLPVVESVPSLVTISPYSLDPLVKAIDEARERIQIANQYLRENNLNEALRRAAARGVKVEVTLASVCTFGRPADRERDRLTNLFNDFDRSGFKTRMFTRQVRIGGKPGYMHAKALVIDGKYAWVGSVNGSDGGLNRNREYGMFFSRRKWVAELMRFMDHDHQHEGTESWQESLDCVKD